MLRQSLACILAILLTLCSTILCFANPLIYRSPSDTENADFQGELPIKRIGPLALPNAIVQFKGTNINILAVPDWLFDRNVVLSGALVKAQVNLKGSTNGLAGLVYFLNGSWITNLGSPNATDVIDTVSGERLHGHIRSQLDNAFAFKPDAGPMRKLSFAEIKNISSPRAYIFSIPTDTGKVLSSGNGLQFDSSSISFSPTHGQFIASKARVPKSTLAGTEPGISKTEIATFIGLNVITDIAPAIAIPLSLNSGTTSQAQHEINQFMAQQRAMGLIP